MDTLSDFLRISKREFALKYCRPVDIGLSLTLSLREKQNHDCIFLENCGCAVYHARPAQCRTYPFWETIIENEKSWEEEGEECPGIGHGPAIPPEVLVDAVVERRRNPPLSIGEVPELNGLNLEGAR